MGAALETRPMTFCQAEPQAAFDYQPPSLAPPTSDPIRIYVACLAAYNNGHMGSGAGDVAALPNRGGRRMGHT